MESREHSAMVVKQEEFGLSHIQNDNYDGLGREQGGVEG